MDDEDDNDQCGRVGFVTQARGEPNVVEPIKMLSSLLLIHTYRWVDAWYSRVPSGNQQPFL